MVALWNVIQTTVADKSITYITCVPGELRSFGTQFWLSLQNLVARSYGLMDWQEGFSALYSQGT